MTPCFKFKNTEQAWISTREIAVQVQWQIQGFSKKEAPSQRTRANYIFEFWISEIFVRGVRWSTLRSAIEVVWLIALVSGGSRISHVYRGMAPTSGGGAPTYYWAKFSPKTACGFLAPIPLIRQCWYTSSSAMQSATLIITLECFLWLRETVNISLFMHGWFDPIHLIHLIGRKSLHYEKKLEGQC